MNPRFVAVSGPREGQSLPLRGDGFSIGRHADNDLQLPQLAVSRHHCVVRGDAGRFTLHDLESRHGTFVNGRPVRERRLEHSDLITVGDTALLFLLDDPSASGAGPAAGSGGIAGGTTILRQPGEALYLHPEQVDAALPAQARIARDLHALLRVSTTLQGPLPVPALAGRLLDALLEVMPAERGAVLLREAGVAELHPAAMRGAGAFTVSRTVLERVLAEKVGLCCESLERDAGANAAASLRDATVRSWLCVPLLGRDDLLGVLYLDRRSPGQGFVEHHLELVTAVAGIASLAFENAFHLRWLERENRRLRSEALDHDMIGESPAMQRLLELLARVARADSTVLVRGESGTGKELAARALHRSSPRAEAPFVAVNCATLSATLLESELFGHEKGAFTGAVARQIGKLEAAHRGTLFLDEVGEIPPTLQAKLLRVLQEREFERVGGSRPIPVDVRVLAATHRDLEGMIAAGSFREDLYYRLKVITLEMPPLRRRRDDIPLLASHFAARHGRRLSRRVAGIAPQARRLLLAYDWPGNVRELGNVIERAVVLGQDEVIRPEDLPDEVLAGAGEEAPSDFQAGLLAAKKKLVLEAWEKAGGDYAATAELLGVHVNSLHRMIRNLGLKPQLER